MCDVILRSCSVHIFNNDHYLILQHRISIISFRFLKLAIVVLQSTCSNCPLWPLSIFRHTDDWSSHRDDNRALRFVHAYTEDVTGNLALNTLDTKLYTPSTVFFDTTNVTYTGANAIKRWVRELLSKLGTVNWRRIQRASWSLTNLRQTKPCSQSTQSSISDISSKETPRPILMRRMFVFEIRDKEPEDGFDDLQFFVVKLVWDTALLKDEIKRQGV